MSRIRTLQELFKRYRRPGDLVFATLFLAFSVWMLASLGQETTWTKRTQLVAQPGFWPAVSLTLMAVFALLHWIGSIASPRIPGRWIETWFWVRAGEYAIWFMIYVLVVPRLGYLPTTIAFTALMALRLGYRRWQTIGWAVLAGIAVVVLFKAFLHVRVPGGAIYEYLPTGLRSFMLTYF